MNSGRMEACFVRLLCATVLLLAPAMIAAQDDNFQNWPEGADPRTVGDHLAQHFLESGHQEAQIVYPEVCLWYGALAYADTTGDANLRAKLQARMQPLLTPEGNHLIPDKEHVDFEIFGTIPLQIYRENKD